MRARGGRETKVGGWTNDPLRCSLGLLPSGPDPVGEWHVPRQPPGRLYGRFGPGTQVGRPRRALAPGQGKRVRGGSGPSNVAAMDSTFSLDFRLAGTPSRSGISTLLRPAPERFPVPMVRAGSASRRPQPAHGSVGSGSGALMEEIRVATRVMMTLASPDKVNVAAIGNIVSQLHVHVVGRFRSDPARPGPAGIRRPRPLPRPSRPPRSSSVPLPFSLAA